MFSTWGQLSAVLSMSHISAVLCYIKLLFWMAQIKFPQKRVFWGVCVSFSGEITISKHITHIPETNKKMDLSPPPKTFQNSKIQKETPIICICILGKDFAAPQNRLDIVLLISSHCSKVSKHWKSMSQFSVAVKCWVELQEPSSKCLKMSTLDMEDFPCLVVELL